MVDDLLEIVLDPIFPPKRDYYKNKNGRPSNYELIYQESGNTTNSPPGYRKI